MGFDRLEPLKEPALGLLREGEVSLALVLSADDDAIVLHLAQESGNPLVGQVGTLGDFLLDFRHSVEPIGGHAIGNGGLDALIGGLLSCGLLLGRVLLSQKLQLMLDESLLSIGQGVVLQDSGEVVALGHLLVSHGINPFWFVRFSFLFVIIV